MEIFDKIECCCDALVIGSGAAGLASAVRLHALGVNRLIVCTEGLQMGTSINTGSDKQTYYKLGMYGAEPDSPYLLAKDLVAGGSVHGDVALVEGACSQLAFANLVMLGVPFPHDEFGQYIGYKTDHDPKRRATSCGPYTSREMCRALIREAQDRALDIREHRICIKLLVKDTVCTGAVFAVCEDDGTVRLETVHAKCTVLAVGGPGGLYEASVYPAVHTGGIGLALAEGAKARNLAESQFGMASTKFRWNVSGSYMQVLPRFISHAQDGISDEKEFLREYFQTPEDMYNAIFLKGYQWPFAAGHVPGSSMIDIYVYRETVVRGRRVFLDYRTDSADLQLDRLSEEAQGYLRKSNACGSTPLERLQRLNEPAIELYGEHGIYLSSEPLEIAVCAQHNNGGLAGNMFWESENIRNLFPVGEVNGSHGVTRPGGTALNAGQCGALRAAETIATILKKNVQDADPENSTGKAFLAELERRFQTPCTVSGYMSERQTFQHRMSNAGAFIRSESAVANALQEAEKQLLQVESSGLAGLDNTAWIELFRNQALLIAQVCYLEAILTHIRSGAGSRGGALVLSEASLPQDHPAQWKTISEDTSYRSQTLETIFQGGHAHSAWAPCRELPLTDGWFESIWKEYREGRIMERKENN